MQGQRGASVGCPAGSSCLQEGTLPRRNGEQRGYGSKGAVLSLASGGAGPSPGGPLPSSRPPGPVAGSAQGKLHTSSPLPPPRPGLATVL